MKNLKSGWKVGLLLGTALVLSACGGGGGGSSVNKPRIRYVNASSDVLPLTFALDGDSKATGVTYPEMSPSFTTEDQNNYDLTVREDGDNPDLDAITNGFGNDREYLVFAVGLKVFNLEPLKRLRLFVSEIDLTIPNGNKSRIYVLHGFNRAAGLDTPNIDLRNPGDNPQYKVENIGYGSIGSLTIDASSQTFVARRSGSDSVYVTETATFDAGGIYLAIISGVEGQVGAQAPTMEFLKLN